ncbi:hypothetical protein FHT08_000666 [Xanthomonas campestris]|uniref:hypothetical protein n=1 Tax=Xanthomonas TaxID=338 RepID=UPI0017D36728|nr:MULTISPECIES: hypothetical protein [Xanthomonas]MBB5734901.1 hypothetical protein [Xanthomonas sp. CFBP 8152]NIJ75618.1 hypothetical protein [Xanthomonas sp. CFBP 8151]
MARQVSIAMLFGVIGLLITSACAAAVGGDMPPKPPAEQVRSDLHKSEKHSEISQDERAKVAAVPDRNQAALEAQPDVVALQPHQGAALHGDQEPITQILIKAGEDGRPIAGARVHLVRRRVADRV